MCFSATASFVTAGVTGVIGVAALIRAREPAALPMAAVPLVFAAQQALEGLLWLTLPVAPDSPGTGTLSLVFLLFAYVIWPVYAPLAALSIEPSPMRRRLIGACLLVGLATAGYLLAGLLSYSHSALIEGGHIVYDREVDQPDGILPPYLLATAGALALSSWPAVRALAGVIGVGYLVALVLYWNAFVSVWCFFAAAASMLILAHFQHVRAAAGAGAREA